jgi:hypothetical protein
VVAIVSALFLLCYDSWRTRLAANLTRLILTTDGSGAGALKGARRADIVIAIELRFVFGPLRSEAELDAFLAPRTTQCAR